jgi:hypothetical protein
VTSLIIYFEDANIIKRLFRDYANNANDYLKDLRDFLHIKQKATNEADMRKLRIKIENFTTQLNRYYIRVISKMKQEIGRAEDESERFRL